FTVLMRCALVLSLLIPFLLAGCDKDERLASLYISSETYYYTPGDKSIPYVPTVYVDDVDTTLVISDKLDSDEQFHDDNEDTVYWVKGGEVWHVKKTCSSLSNSKNILTGSIEEAMSNGKTRKCSRCGY
ncbi:MAG: hypothetical protein IJF48_00620, partial [Clostridia bacterium]|nr:hypothetical protein [Clostridia bacterium]